YTLKSPLSRVVTMRCLSSTTVACSTTSSTSLRKTKTPLSEASGFCAEFGTAFGAAPCSVEAGTGGVLAGPACDADGEFAAVWEPATAAGGDWLGAPPCA